MIFVLSRFSALNPHGTLDFQLTSEGNISEYFGGHLIILYPFVIPLTEGWHCRHDYCKLYLARLIAVYLISRHRPTPRTGKIRTW
jgi:hypothetical protein